MKKLIKFLVYAILILLFILFLIKGYESEKEDIASKIGIKVGEGELSMSDYYNLVQIIEDNYKKYLVDENYLNAYGMLSPNYRKYISFEDFENKMSKKDNKELKVVNIKRVTQTTYHVSTNLSGDDFTIIINKDEGTFSLIPESFLTYQKVNIKNNNKKLKCILQDYLVNIEKTTINMEFENDSKEDIKINKAILKTNLDDVIKSETDITIPAKQTKQISLTFDTYYAFPKELEIYRSNGEKADIKYTFSIK